MKRRDPGAYWQLKSSRLMRNRHNWPSMRRSNISHDSDCGAVAQPFYRLTFDGIQQLPRLGRLQNLRDPNLAARLRAFDEERRISWNDLFDDKPVEEHAQRREMLFHGGRAQGAGCYMKRGRKTDGRFGLKAPRRML